MSEEPPGLPPEILREADKVASLVTTARRLLGERKMIDLSALEGKVKALCDAVRDVPGGDVPAVKASLTAILDDLDRLEEELRIQNEEVNAEMVRAARRQAMEAYSKGES